MHATELHSLKMAMITALWLLFVIALITEARHTAARDRAKADKIRKFIAGL